MRNDVLLEGTKANSTTAAVIAVTFNDSNVSPSSSMYSTTTSTPWVCSTISRSDLGVDEVELEEVATLGLLSSPSEVAVDNSKRSPNECSHTVGREDTNRRSKSTGDLSADVTDGDRYKQRTEGYVSDNEIQTLGCGGSKTDNHHDTAPATRNDDLRKGTSNVARRTCRNVWDSLKWRRKGMVVVAVSRNPRLSTCWEFEADMVVVFHPSR